MKLSNQATVIYQPAHAPDTKFARIADYTLRWPSGGLPTVQNNYPPKAGDCILMDYGASRQNLDAHLATHGLKKGECVGGVAYQLEAI